MKKAKKNPLSMNYWFFSIVIILGILTYAKPERVLNEIFILVLTTLILDASYFFIVCRYTEINLEREVLVDKGEELEVKFSLFNRAYLPSPFIYIQPKEGVRVSLQEEQYIGILLAGRGKMSGSIKYKALFSGVEEISLDEIVLRSFIGFFIKKVKIEEATRIRILPEIKKLSHIEYFYHLLKMKDYREQGGNSGKLNTGSEIGYELRPYVEGDSQKLIHWKLAAFKEEYFVRQMEGERIQKDRLFFILNPFIDKVNLQNEVRKQDKMITTFVSLIAYYLNQGEHVKIAYYKEKEWKLKELNLPAHLKNLQESLCDYKGIKLEDTMNQREIIKSVLNMAKMRRGAKVLISGCWKQEIEDFILNYGSDMKEIPVIWWESERPKPDVLEGSSFSFLHMTDEYELMLVEHAM